jgi:hypothetical protein
MNINKPVFRSIIGLFILAVYLTACDNSFDPTDRDNGTYSVHGMLDLMKKSNYIRVRNMNAPFTLEATEDLEATVTLQNLESGEITQLQSFVREYRGVYLHTFSYDEKAIPDTGYLLTVEGSDGFQTQLETVTPTHPEPQFIREDDGCTTPVNIVLDPMNGGTLTMRFGTELDTEDEDGMWGRIYTFGPSIYENSVSFTITPLITAQGIEASFGTCFSLLPDGNLYLAIAHYSPGFYEELNAEVTDILETTRRFGGFYADTLAIPVDPSR